LLSRMTTSSPTITASPYEQLVLDAIDSFDDDWKRRAAVSIIQREYLVFGHRLVFETNSPVLDTALERSLARFVPMPPRAAASRLNLRLFVRDDWAADAPDLSNRVRAAAHEEWLSLTVGEWGQGFADLKRRFALGFIAPALAAQTEVVSRFLIDSFILRMLYRDPISILHSSCLTKNGKAVLLIGPHGVGKSTTAARLLSVGYRLLADSLVLSRWREDGDGLEMFGYPSGELKLTPDTLPLFPNLAGVGEEVLSRGRQKWMVSLHKQAPELISDYLPRVKDVTIYLIQRATGSHTHRHSLAPEDAFRRLLPDTDYLEEIPVMAQNLAVTETLIQQSHCFIAEIGTDPSELIEVLAGK
jgi:hypothetical protein